MTEGRIEKKIIQEKENIILGDFIIPMGTTKEDIKQRERLIWEMYGHWAAETPDKKCYNNNLKSDIYVTFESISETSNKAARLYISTMAFWDLDFVLKNAYKVDENAPRSKRQQKFYKILIMEAKTSFFLPYFNLIKMTVGVTKIGRNNMYCITAIQPIIT